MKTIRDLITEKSILLRDIDTLGAGRASEELVALSSLLSSLNAEIVDKQFLLNQKKVELLEEHKTVAKAKMISESSFEWMEWFSRVQQRDALINLIQSVKYYLKQATEEYKNL